MQKRTENGCRWSLHNLRRQRKSIEFCWDYQESQTCEKWANHRDFGRQHDTFKCYQKLEGNISTSMQEGVESLKE